VRSRARVRFCLTPAVVAAMLLLPAGAGARQPSAAVLDASVFANRLRDLAATIETLDARDAPRLADSIPGIQRVRAAGVTYDVRLDTIRQTLLIADNRRDWQVVRRGLVNELAVMRREAEAASLADAADRGERRRTLDGVLARPEFQRARGLSWRTALLRRIQRRLRDLFAPTMGRSGGLYPLAVALAWIAPALALVVLLLWFARTGLRLRREPAVGLGAVAPPRAAARELSDRAVDLAAQGRFREAARTAYRATVRRLEEEGTWRTDDTRTPREYLRLLSPAHRRRATVARVTADFERVWYGSRDATADDWHRFAAVLEDLGCLPGAPVT
jgi:uncharacterized protein DUF4129